MAVGEEDAPRKGLARIWIVAALALGICVGYFLGGQSSTQSFLAQKISAPAKTLPALEPPAVSAKAPQVANASKVPWPPQHRNSGKLPKQPWVSGNKTNPCVPQPHHLSSRGGYAYHPSKLEKLWSETPRRGKICELATDEEQLEQVKLWLNYTAAIFHPRRGEAVREPSEKEAEVLSYFSYPQPDGTVIKRYIEPLHGIGRHPWAVCYKHNFQMLYDVRYLMPENGCRAGTKRPRGMFFDLGCTSNKGTKDFHTFDYSTGSGAGPSIPLFFNMYRDRCIDFMQMYGWEVRDLNHPAWWAPLPDDIRSRVHFYNVPVEENLCPESPQGDFKKLGSFLHMLPSTVTVEDYVVVKVDIDSLGASGGPELAIVEAIAHLPELSQLVDELYFEYHYYFDGLDFGWGKSKQGGRDVDTAMNLMVRLREAGIRSHFWI